MRGLSTAAPVLRIVSGLVLVALAIRGLFELRVQAPVRTPAPGDVCAVLWADALVLGAGVAMGGTMEVIAFTIGAFAASLSWQLLLAEFGSWAGKTCLTACSSPPRFSATA